MVEKKEIKAGEFPTHTDREIETISIILGGGFFVIIMLLVIIIIMTFLLRYQ